MRIANIVITALLCTFSFSSATYAETWKAVSYNPSLEDSITLGTGNNLSEATANALRACEIQYDANFGCVMGASGPRDWEIVVLKCPWSYHGMISVAMKMLGSEVVDSEPDTFAREAMHSGVTVSEDCEVDLAW